MGNHAGAVCSQGTVPCGTDPRWSSLSVGGGWLSHKVCVLLEALHPGAGEECEDNGDNHEQQRWLQIDCNPRSPCAMPRVGGRGVHGEVEPGKKGDGGFSFVFVSPYPALICTKLIFESSRLFCLWLSLVNDLTVLILTREIFILFYSLCLVEDGRWEWFDWECDTQTRSNHHNGICKSVSKAYFAWRSFSIEF